MAARKPLVSIGGRFKELPSGDSVEGVVDTTSAQSIGGVKTLTSPLLFADGSAAGPSFSFASDTGANTGFYFLGQNELGFTANGAQRIKFGTYGAEIVSGGLILSAADLGVSHAGTVLTDFTSTDGGAVQFRVISTNATNRRFLGQSSAGVTESQMNFGAGEIHLWGSATTVKLGHFNATAFDPDDDSIKTLGTAAKRWNNIFTGGYVNILRTGDAATAQFIMDTDAGQSDAIYFRTAGSHRWIIQKNNTAESGSNAGSDFVLTAYNDAGTSLGNALSISRATQIMAIVQTPTHPTPADGDNTTKSATTAYAMGAAPNASYRSLLDCSASHTAARAAGTYWLGQGHPAGVTGVGTLDPPNILYIDPADYPTVNGLATKLRLRVGLAVNDVAPTGNYTFGLYPVTRPGASGGAGLCIYTMGTVVSGSTVVSTAPAADSNNNLVGSDFAIPSAGFYVIGFVSTAAVAASSHLHVSAVLQMRNN